MDTLSGDLVYSGNAKMVQTKQGYASVRRVLYFDLNFTFREQCRIGELPGPILLPGTFLPAPQFGSGVLAFRPV